MKILVIDDEKEILLLVSKVLERNDYEVTTAESILAASKLIHNNTWDLIISDVMLPYLGGFELVEDIKATYSTPVILITGMSEDVFKATINKADKILYKPFSSDELINAVKQLTAGATTSNSN